MNSKTRLAIVCLLSSALLPMVPGFDSSAFGATIYDAAADFSPTSNPNGVWSYGSSTTLGSAFILGTTSGNTSGIDYWINDWFSAAPSVTHNGTGSAITVAFITWGPGQLGFHPGPSSEYAIVRFTAPDTSLYDLASSFSGLDSTISGTDVYVLLNSASIFDGTVTSFGSGPSFATQLSLAAGDTVDFVVGDLDGNHFNDTTGLSATLTAVPEPSSLALVATGVLGAVVAARRRRARFNAFR